MSKAAGAFEYINNSLKGGKTVYIQTALRTTKVTPKVAASWEKSGHQLFKLVNDVLFMAQGKGFVCIVEKDIVHTRIAAQ